MVTEIKGDLIKLAKSGAFDVIVHGCNCFQNMGGGIALQMAEHFDADRADSIEHSILNDPAINSESNNIELLGNVNWFNPFKDFEVLDCPENLTVVNAYTQYEPGKNLDAFALTLCLRKINHIFKGKHIGLPQIGCGIAGGDWAFVSTVIENTLIDCQVTVVIYERD